MNIAVKIAVFKTVSSFSSFSGFGERKIISMVCKARF